MKLYKLKKFYRGKYKTDIVMEIKQVWDSHINDKIAAFVLGMVSLCLLWSMNMNMVSTLHCMWLKNMPIDGSLEESITGLVWLLLCTPLEAWRAKALPIANAGGALIFSRKFSVFCIPSKKMSSVTFCMSAYCLI